MDSKERVSDCRMTYLFDALEECLQELSEKLKKLSEGLKKEELAEKTFDDSNRILEKEFKWNCAITR